jgi:hypothetical protein
MTPKIFRVLAALGSGGTGRKEQAVASRETLRLKLPIPIFGLERGAGIRRVGHGALLLLEVSRLVYRKDRKRASAVHNALSLLYLRNRDN